MSMPSPRLTSVSTPVPSIPSSAVSSVAVSRRLSVRPAGTKDARSLRRGFPRLFTIGVAWLAVAACGGGGAKVHLPSSTPLSTPPRSPSPTSLARSGKAAVAAAYTALFPATDRALLARPEQIRAILQPYVTGDYLDLSVRGIIDEQARHLEPFRHVVVHITKIDIKQDTATVHDCQDASNAGLADARTHQLDPKTRGSAHRTLVAQMTLGGDGRWRVRQLRQFNTSCHR
jgi:hypothetical protein